jgi:DNA invertase Pin-like site-specific DNA recombinase
MKSTPPQARLRAVIYARVSSAAQRERDTIASQLTVLPRAVHERGWELVRPADTYVDDGISGATGHLAQRHGLQRLLADAAAGVFDVVVVIDYDRISRSEDWSERGLILGALQGAGVKIYEASTGSLHDLSDAQGDLLVGLRAYFAAEENRKRRERTIRGKDRAIASGRKPSGVTPYGYRYDRESGEFTIEPAEATVIREIYRRVGDGESCAAIELDFNGRAIPTGPESRSNRAAQWTLERINHLVHKPIYRGEWTVDKRRRLTLKVPALVDEATWYRAVDALARWGRRGLRRTRHVYLCESIATCTLCEANIGISTHSYMTSARRMRHAYYVCAHRRRVAFGAERCELPMRQVAEVDERVWNCIHDLLGNVNALAERIAAQAERARGKVDGWERDVSGFKAHVARLDKTEQALLARFRRGKIGERALDHELDELQRERAFVRQQLESAQRAVASGQATRHPKIDLRAMRQLAERANATERRAIVQTIIPGHDDFRIRLGARSIEAMGGLWPDSPAIAHGGVSSWRNSGESNRANPLVRLELVA